MFVGMSIRRCSEITVDESFELEDSPEFYMKTQKVFGLELLKNFFHKVWKKSSKYSEN